MPNPKSLLACLLLTLAPLPAARALEPSEVAVVFNSTNAQSLALAEYYIHARGIPRDNLIPVRCSDAQSITEREYEQTVVPWVRSGIHRRNLDGKIKCLVTIRGMPLVVGPLLLTAAEKAESDGYTKELKQAFSELQSDIAVYDTIAAPLVATAPATQADKPITDFSEFPALIQKLNTAASAAARRIDALPALERGAALEQMLRVHQQVAGLQGVLAAFQIRDDTPGAAAAYARRNAMQSKLQSLNSQYQQLVKSQNRPGVRKQMIDIQSDARGLIGRVNQLEASIRYLSPDETSSCLDSELALVFNDQNYPRYRWILNARSVENFQTLRHVSNCPQPIMITRLDGLSNEEVTHMIDTGIEVEKKGLDGKIYLDARGIHNADGYGLFDADVRRAADWLKTNSTMPVILDDTGALFQAKDCPDAALYCGWYSLHHYRDSCQWLPGSVAYHVASFEMPTLHDPKDTGWVPNLLKRGVCGTLGAVAEPYLTAFPKPSQFFPLLLCGEFTQGEVWEVTNPTESWMIGYVGDPLYNPFKNKPRVKIATLKEDAVLRNAWEILRPATSSATHP